jgi:hypothetical protein
MSPDTRDHGFCWGSGAKSEQAAVVQGSVHCLADCLYIAIVGVPEAPFDENLSRDRREPLKPEEIRKLDAFFKRTFQNPRLEVKARPRKDDSAEVYVGDEFLGIVFKDEDDGDYNFSMAILEIDL